jgi:hypothetical protein
LGLGNRLQTIILGRRVPSCTSVREATGQQFQFFIAAKAQRAIAKAMFYLKLCDIHWAVALGFEMNFGPRFPVDLAMVLALNVVVAVLIYCGIMLWGLLGT